MTLTLGYDSTPMYSAGDHGTRGRRGTGQSRAMHAGMPPRARRKATVSSRHIRAFPCRGSRVGDRDIEKPAAAPHHHRKRACSALAQRGRPHAGDRAGSGTNIAGLGMARQHRGDRSRRAVFLHSMVISDCRCCWQDAIQPCSLPMVTARGWRNPATVATTTATGRSSPTEDENSGDWFNRPCSLISEVSGQSDRDNVRRACSSATMSAVCHARAGSAAAFVNSAGTQPLATSPHRSHRLPPHAARQCYFRGVHAKRSAAVFACR